MLAAAVLLLVVTVTNTLFPKVIEIQFEEEGKVLAVHVMPSGLDAAAVLAPEFPPETARNELFPKVTELQGAVVGKVLAVHVMPSMLVAAIVPLVNDTATKTPFP
jgi:hypothetical protein